MRHVVVTNSIFHVRHTVIAQEKRTAAIRTLIDKLLRLERKKALRWRIYRQRIVRMVCSKTYKMMLSIFFILMI